MILLEPGRTPYDLRFSIFGIPVRVHPLFWLVSIFMADFQAPPALVAIWVAVLFFSILVHELGHALAFRRFGQQPRIVLYAMGGLATAEPMQNSYEFHYSRPLSTKERVIISFAGPLAGFLLALLVVIVIVATRGEFQLVRDFPTFWRFRLGIGGLDDYEQLYYLVHDLMWVNVFWGLMNLLPIFPLDGGQIARELYTARNPHNGLQQALWLSVITSGAVIVVAMLALAKLGGEFSRTAFFIVLLFGALGVQNFLILQQLGGEGKWR